ncbi:MAG: hypothetical protein JWQ38_1731 [Flavipsychrobacter sp.]|nr:hypothetical protein [Flavipsychrobacter sp.]
MTKHISFVLFSIIVLCSGHVYAQGRKAILPGKDRIYRGRYDSSMAMGRRYQAGGNTSMALKRYQDAAIAARQCGIPGSTAAAGIDSAFKDIENSKKKALSLALSSQANNEVYANHDLAMGFRYAQYAYEADSNNADAWRLLYICGLQQGEKAPQLFPSLIIKDSSDFITVNLSSDGARMVTVSADSIIRIWNTATGDIIAWFRPISNTHRILQAKISANGKNVFAYNYADTIMYLFDIEHRALQSIPTTKNSDCRLSPDGERIVIHPYYNYRTDSFARPDLLRGSNLN